ncbi:MAG: hypothetical protein HYZ13_09130 [Acidobacteria bacterium]|nr:hypothetical protein [Acidobacteriota bacterium]
MPGLEGLLKGLAGLASPKPKGTPGTQGRRPLPFYSFEVWDADGCVKADVLPDGAPPKVILRIPPSHLERHHPIRAQVFQGLDGLPVVVEAGLGLARWTLSGSHGVGPTLLLPDGAQASGLHSRNQLESLFTGYARENRRRSGQGEPLLRMVFAIRDGSLTEFVNRQWWIQPESLPVDLRNASRPREWAWSLAFWALEELPPAGSKPAAKDALTPPSAAQIEKKGQGLLAKLKDEIKAAFAAKDTSLLGRLRALQKGMRTLIRRAQDLRRATTRIVNSVRDLTVGVVKQVNALLGEVNRLPGLRGNPALGRLLMATRRWGGSIQRHLSALEQGRLGRVVR